MKPTELTQSKSYEYSVFTRKVFNKPNSYILCYRNLPVPKKWYDILFHNSRFSFNYWQNLSQDGTTAQGYKKTFVTESKEEIINFMKWNIKKDNNELI